MKTTGNMVMGGVPAGWNGLAVGSLRIRRDFVSGAFVIRSAGGPELRLYPRPDCGFSFACPTELLPCRESDLAEQSEIRNPQSEMPLPLCRLGPGGDFSQDYTPGVSPDQGALPDRAPGASGTTVAAGSGPASPASRQDGASLTVGGPGSGFAKAR